MLKDFADFLQMVDMKGAMVEFWVFSMFCEFVGAANHMLPLTGPWSDACKRTAAPAPLGRVKLELDEAADTTAEVDGDDCPI